MKLMVLLEMTKFAGTPVPLSFPGTKLTMEPYLQEFSTVLNFGKVDSKDGSSTMLWKTRNNVPSISLPISITGPSLMVNAGPGGSASGVSALTLKPTAVKTSAGSKCATRTVATEKKFATSGTLASMITNGISTDGTLWTATRMKGLPATPWVLLILLKTTSEAPSA